MFVVISILLFAIVARYQNEARNIAIGDFSDVKEAMSNRDSSQVCTGDDCERFGVIIGSVVGAHIILILLIIGLIYCCKHYKGKPVRSNSTFVNKTMLKNTEIEIHELTRFQTGLWTSRYYQNNKWHGPHLVSLSFDPSTLKITGFGSDDFSAYTLNGTYSMQTCRIGLTQTYDVGMDHLTETSKETVIIQLTWNSKSIQFEGKWYGRIDKFHGEGKFELKFDGIQPFSTNEDYIDA